MRTPAVEVAGPIVLVVLVALVGLAGPACGPVVKDSDRPTARADAGPARAPEGRIQLACEPTEAQVNIDGRDFGSAASIARRGGLTLPHGLHRIEITLQGYRPFRFELILGTKPEALKVQLQPTGSTQ